MKLSAILLLAGSLAVAWPLAASDEAAPPAAEPESTARKDVQKAKPADPNSTTAKEGSAPRAKDAADDATPPQNASPADAATPVPAQDDSTAGNSQAPAVGAQPQPVQTYVSIPVAFVGAPSAAQTSAPAGSASSAAGSQSAAGAAAPAVDAGPATRGTMSQQSFTQAIQRSVILRRKHGASDNFKSAAATTPQYTTGQGGRLVIGQPRFSSQRGTDITTTPPPNASSTTTYETLQTLVGSAQGVAYANGTLVVADANRQGGTPNNNRVLLYNNIQSWMPGPHDMIPQNGTPCPACFGAGSKTPPPTSGSPWPGASIVLGQPDFVSNNPNQVATAVYPPAPIDGTKMSSPVGVAYNGQMLAVADTANNRVLIWKSLPTANDQPADYVVGQADFTTFTPGKYGAAGFPIGLCSATSLRSPTAVYLDALNGLWVADTGNDRVLYYGPITGNGQAATLVLGQAEFNHDAQNQYVLKTTASSLLAPTSVSSDGTHLFVADSFQNRVLIWNSIPTTNNQAADVVVGQQDFVSNLSNTYSTTTDAAGTIIQHSVLCASNGNDTTSETGKSFPTYPPMCAATLSNPMDVISDGTRLYIADSGNDRVLVYNTIPMANAVSADVILGQTTDTVDLSSDSAYPEKAAGTDSFKSPNSLAWDGADLYVADTFNRRIVVYSPGDFTLPQNAVLSAASAHTYARGTIAVGGTTQNSVVATVTIGNSTNLDSSGNEITVDYTYTTHATDSLAVVINALVTAINSANNGAGDPWVYAIADTPANLIILTSKAGDAAGNDITLATSLNPTTATLTLTASGATITGGIDASLLAPYEIVRVRGASGQILVPGVDPNNPPPVQPLNQTLPNALAGVTFFVDGIQCPLVVVNQTFVVAQLPIELSYALQPDTTPPSSNSTINVTDTLRFPRTGSAVLRVQNPDGTVQTSTAVGLPVIQQNPSLYYDPTQRPNPGLAFHSSSYATATVSVDGTITAGDVATITIRDRAYNYTVSATDTTDTVRDQLIAYINAYDPEVRATRAGAFQRVRLQAIVPGPAGDGIPVGASSPTSSTIIMTAFNTELCCANVAGAPITTDNPAVPGETISVYGTGLGILSNGDQQLMFNGQPFEGSPYNNVTFDGFVAATAGGSTANVLFSGLKLSYVGLYQIDLELNTSLKTDPLTPLYIAQLYQTSNIVTIPVVNPAPAN